MKIAQLLAETAQADSGAFPLIATVTIFILAIFVGLEVIAKVPQALHTPLMSATNAIHGVILVGGLLILGKADSPAMMAIGVTAVFFGTMNVVGGFVVTDRMLEMFRGKKRERK